LTSDHGGGGSTVDNAVPLNDLTLIQREILKAIRRLTRDRGHPPCMREVLENIHLDSPGALSYQYGRLEAQGHLRREAGRPRTVEVRLPGEPAFPSEAREPEQLPGDTEPEAGETPGHARPEKVVWVPIVGRIAAGGPILAQQESAGEYLPLPREVVGREEELFILEVVGDSMIGVGIFSGDWVVVRPLFQAPQNGDIVAATIDGVELEGTVKTYKKVGRHVWLMPQNPAYTPIPGGRATFAGKVVAVLRRV
jgi:repressor LexA